MIDLKKHDEPGSLREIASRHWALAPCDLPIAGKSREAILSAMRREGFAVGRISADNAFAVRDGDSIYYLFVRPAYTGYRHVARLRFGSIPPDHDVDHVHARNFATRFGYCYVLVALVPSPVNRKHGNYEKPRGQPDTTGDVPEVCFVDVRIVDKVLGRDSKARRSLSALSYRYDPHDRTGLGLTLKQRGLWNLAFGFDRPAPEEFVRVLKPL